MSSDEKSRYLRHLLLDEIGTEGQLKLKNSSILCVGAGGLGSPALLYLAAAGVGRIGIVDPDVVDSSNLQRQILYTIEELGISKAQIAKKKLLALNPLIQVEAFEEQFEAQNAERLLSGYDAIMDCTDNFSTRYLVNDVALRARKPNFFGCIFKFTGQVTVFGSESGCYRCVFPVIPGAELAPDCARTGVLGALPGLIGTYQALEFLKWRLGIGTSLVGKLLSLDLLDNSFRTLSYKKNPHCPACKDPSSIRIVDYDSTWEVNAEDGQPYYEISAGELRKKITNREDFFLLDVRDPKEYALENLGGVLVPVEELAKSRLLLPEDLEKTIVVHCHSGIRSVRACKILRGLGYRKLFHLTGGLLAWQRAARTFQNDESPDLQ